MPRLPKPASPFRYFNSSSEVIRLVVMMYVRFPLSLRNIEDLLFVRGIDISRVCGGTGAARYLPVKSVDRGCRGCVAFVTGSGTWTKGT